MKWEPFSFSRNELSARKDGGSPPGKRKRLSFPLTDFGGDRLSFIVYLGSPVFHMAACFSAKRGKVGKIYARANCFI